MIALHPVGQSLTSSSYLLPSYFEMILTLALEALSD